MNDMEKFKSCRAIAADSTSHEATPATESWAGDAVVETISIGHLEQVDLRRAWMSEAGDFTPWLAKPENLRLLGDTIKMELELEAQEKNVGPFRADLLCKDTANNDWVLIENQLERTDHSHLGQVLTYAAGLKAATVVWIAREFTEEHRAALDWLNEITGEHFSFFGLEIELWKIGNSPMAPKFNVVCKPNDWTKPPPGPVTDTQALQHEYWTGVMELLRNRKSGIKPTKPAAQSWCTLAVGRSNFTLTVAMNTLKGWIQVNLSCLGDDALAHFRLLQQQKQSIEQELGGPLEWEELPGKKEKRLALRLYDLKPLDRDDWPRQHAWLADKVDTFYKVFSPRVKALDAEEAAEPRDE